MESPYKQYLKKHYNNADLRSDIGLGRDSITNVVSKRTVQVKNLNKSGFGEVVQKAMELPNVLKAIDWDNQQGHKDSIYFE